MRVLPPWRSPAAASRCGQSKDLLPVFDERWRDGLRKDLAARRAEGWAEVYRAIKAAKLGVRCPHPRLASDPGGRLTGGIAVRRLGPAPTSWLIARPVGGCQPERDSSENRQLIVRSTR